MSNVVHLDYETRSAADLKSVGAHRYAIDSTTEILMAAVSDGGEVKLWINPAFGGSPENVEVGRLLAEAEIIWAHNAPFEQAITWGAAQRGAVSPFKTEPDLSVWRCTAALARKAGLPASLEKCGEALNIGAKKDVIGNKLISYFSIPQDNGTFHSPETSPEKWVQFCNYCRQDVRAEKEIHRKLKPFELQGAPLETFQFDLRMNQRGIPINLSAARNAQNIIDSVQQGVTEEFRELTGLNPTQRQKVLDLVNSLGVKIEDMQAETLASLTVDQVVHSPKAARILELYSKLSYAAIKKVRTMLDSACPDGVIRGTFKYYGAGTGRWCLTGDHEVLTPQGWARLDSWGGGVIACWNKDELVSFQKATAVSFPFRGKLYHQKSQRIDQLATGDHRCPGWAMKSQEFQVRFARELVSGFQIPYTGVRVKPAQMNPDELRLLIAVQADGHYFPDGAIDFHFKKKRKIDRLREIFNRLGLPFSTTYNADKSVNICLRSRHTPLFLHLFRDKTFGPWLLDVDATVFFEELELWDGSRSGPNSIQYSTTNRANADWVQALAHTSGMAASIAEKRANRKWAPCYYVSIWLTPSNRNQLPCRPETKPFSGLVYCAKTPTGFFLVRRNGRVWVTGNSAQGLQPHNFKKTPEKLRPITDEVYRRICDGWTGPMLDAVYGEPFDLIAGCIRNFIQHPTYELLDGDYSGIEARIIAWLAKQDDVVAEWQDYDERGGPGPYKHMAAYVYGVPVASVTKDQREVGKRIILGAGFGMGPDKFRRSCLEMYQLDLPAELCERGIKAFREKCHKIVAYWYKLDDNARNAIAHPGATFGPFLMRDIGGVPFLLGRLPSGRSLAYPFPKLETLKGDENWGAQITYWGQLPMSQQWGRVKLYGGKIAENCLGEDTEVLTNRGWIPIQEVLLTDLVWDGEEWVCHEGLICKGEQDTIEFAGVQLTPEHRVFEQFQDIPAERACTKSAFLRGFESWLNLVYN